jgi:D-sedoheptulose 7-phosphate isomerase
MTELCDFLLDVPHAHTPLIQEVQLTIGHLLCQLTDYYLFEDAAALQADLEAAE